MALLNENKTYTESVQNDILTDNNSPIFPLEIYDIYNANIAEAFSNDIIFFEEPPDVAVEEEIFCHDLTSCFNLAADNGLGAGISSDQNKENTSNQINTDVEPNIDSDYELESTIIRYPLLFSNYLLLSISS
ncbi:uncharacterized protein LOC126891940 [Diabrotica virgifera virgifera]|uniref:Uncharacterized protein n=1 Tax=Diabrotica virgifera virgifera TaxID=50390 RepID=A0ABM5K3Z2_DIAVI|nr:uncharacterized protein LOC126883412 [Diabrotica virgifera virgifera]XP_050517246.1 uncharacterized protein LOC126891940 [Diabrotica virgifera virgifera]